MVSASKTRAHAIGMSSGDSPHRDWYTAAMEQLIVVIQQLSDAHDLDTVTAVVRKAARELTGADGATFVLKDGDQCYYVEENAISPLWKGRRFPLTACISGWAMLHGEAAVIEDIYSDPRIPHDAYRPTFVKSLAMVPVRRQDPIAAIGNYWARPHRPTAEEVAILQALADTTSVALKNAGLYTELAQKVKALEESNNELSRFAWVASHDLQEPLRTVSIQLDMLKRKLKHTLDAEGEEYIHYATEATARLRALIEALLTHAEADKQCEFATVDLQTVIAEVKANLHAVITECGATLTEDALPPVHGNMGLLEHVLQNLYSNAMKFCDKTNPPVVHLSATANADMIHFSLTDNGIGIEPDYQQNIFELFKRLHSKTEYPGSGVGLATCKKIIELHGGQIWVESAQGKGSVFHFTLPAART